jgi:hypothetical protein
VSLLCRGLVWTGLATITRSARKPLVLWDLL